MNLPHPNLNAKLGPLPRKAWLGIGSVGGIFLYLRHRATVAQAAQAGDGTTAGSALDANGNYVNAAGTSGTGGTPLSAYDPYTSGYNGYGYNLLLGSGGIATSSGSGSGTPATPVTTPTAPPPVGQDGTDAGPVVAPAISQNPSAPGAAASSPQSLTVNYWPPTQTPPRTVAAPSKARRHTAHRAVRQSMHNAKNGRPHSQHRQGAPKHTAGHQNRKVTDRAANRNKPRKPKAKPPRRAKRRRRLTGGVGY